MSIVVEEIPIPYAGDNFMELTHLDGDGSVTMVDVSYKDKTLRQAVAQGEVIMSPSTLAKIQYGNGPKGDVVTTAKLAGIMAAKQTPQLIPLCHSLPLTGIKVEIDPDENLPGYRITATVKTNAETGVEMEALTAVTISALTLYDMAKGIEKTIEISNIRLISKVGGKSGEFKQ